MQPAEWLRTLLDAVMDFRHTPDGMVRGGEYVRADALIEAASIAAPAAPVAQPLTPEQIDAGANEIDDEAAFVAGFAHGVRFAERAHGIGQGGA